MVQSGTSTPRMLRGAAVIATASVALVAPIVSAAPSSAVISDCVLTQGHDFTDAASLQTQLDGNTCPGPTMFVNFSTGFPLMGTELSWSDNLGLTFTGTGTTRAILNARGNSRVLNSTSTKLVTISNMSIEGGYSTSEGAGINTDGDVALVKSVVKGNSATGTGALDGGGGVNAENILATDSDIAMNQTAGGGGGGGLFGLGVSLTRTKVRNNVNTSAGAGGGGGVAAYGDFLATDSLISNNIATTTMGGGILGSNVTLVRTRVLSNVATDGGGISAGVSGGTAGVSMLRSTVSDNFASGGGGGIMSSGGPTIAVSSTISDNTALAGDSGGGGVYSAQQIQIARSTVSGNSTGGNGGGLRSGTAVTAVNSTIADNSSMRSGGGVFGRTIAWTFKFATLANNTSIEPGANVSDGTGATSFASTGSIFANSSGADSCVGVSTVATGSYNAKLAGDTSCGLTGTGNIAKTWASMKLGKLALNSSNNDTFTMLPGTGSSLIATIPTNAGQASIGPNAIDQRGKLREGKFTNGAAQPEVKPPPPPPPPLTQKLVNCGPLPQSKGGIAKNGWTRLATAGCETNAGQPVTIVGQAVVRGDVRTFKIVRAANGAGFIRTYGVPLWLRITWSAPATGRYLAYSKSLPYIT